MACVLDLVGESALVMVVHELCSLEANGVEVFEWGHEVFGGIGCVCGQLLQLQYFSVVASTRVLCGFYLSLRDVRFRVQCWVQFSSDIDWILDAWSASTLVGAVWKQHAYDGCAEGFGMNVVHQFGFVLVEARVFSSFVSCAKYVFCDLVLLLIVDDGFGVAVGCRVC